MKRLFHVFIIKPALAAVMVIATAVPQPALAERVYVTRSNGEQGQGWLFGAKDRAGDLRCWVALPSHVVGERSRFEDPQLHPFDFRTASGRSGSSGVPVSVRQLDNAEAVLGRNPDLAFAAVSGFRGGECLSRLGLPELVYDLKARQNLELDVVTIGDGRQNIFRMRVSRTGLDGNKAIQLLDPLTDEDAAKYLKGGVSGAIATFPYLGDDIPFAMIVANLDNSARAIRFDAIRKSFEPIKRKILMRDVKSSADTAGTIPYRIVRLDGISVLNDSGMERLSDPAKCWKMAPKGGKTAVVLELEPDLDLPLSGVVFRRDDTCGTGGIDIGIDVSYNEGRSWSRVSDCALEEQMEETYCRFNLRKAASIRISAKARVAAFSQILLQPK
ncbi:hypothetical protein FMN50_15135 [Rhodobacterales bacterium]|nr:hypothetical protein FMN50_15135 [Rhodobacterales bacterium]